jgi:hypothetical protein
MMTSKEQAMSEMTLFKGGLPAYLKEMQDETTTALAGGGDFDGQYRISIKGGAFREMLGNKEVRVSEERAMNVIIIKSAPNVYRSYYSGAYVEGENASPACWSIDNQVPAATVPADKKQATKCMDCKQNVKGSGQGESRACRYQQRVAVLVEGEVEKRRVAQLILPATSIFGEGEKGKLPLQAYGRHLKAHGTPVTGVVTEMRFDINSPTPKLHFKPVRPITEDEFEVVNELRNSPAAEEAVKFVVTPPKAKEEAFETKAETKKTTKVEKVEAEEVEEPKKAVSKKTAEPAPELADLVDNWDD